MYYWDSIFNKSIYVSISIIHVFAKQRNWNTNWHVCQPDEHMTPASWVWEHVVKPIKILLYAQEKRDDSVPVQVRPVNRISPAPWPKYAFVYGTDEPCKWQR